MTVPPGAVSPTRTAVFLAVLTHPHPNYGTIMDATGLSRTTVRHHLVGLRDEGLITWEPYTHGTIRATITAVRRGNDLTPKTPTAKVESLR